MINNARNKNVHIQKHKKMSFFKLIRFFITAILLVGVAGLGILGGSIYGIIKKTPPLNESLTTDVKINSTVYDSNGKKIATLRDKDINREWISLDKVQEELKLAFIAIEDKRFYEHDGVDYQGLIGAVFSKVIHPTQQMRGASTLTMQLVKNLTNNDARQIDRKVQEQHLAKQLEEKLVAEKGSKKAAKDVILEKYINQINLGGNMNGVKIAAKYYFNKDLEKDKLTLTECACLASITKHPAAYSPTFKDSNSENNKNNEIRRSNVLKVMLDEDFITNSQYDSAINEKIKYVKGDLDENSKSSQSYFVDSVVDSLIKDFVSTGMNEQEALSYVHSGGLKIYTTIDQNIQKAMDSIFTDSSNFPTTNYEGYKTQASMVLLDSATGQVKALYGGYGEKESVRGFNMATSDSMMRSPGSTFKPISAYGPAIDTQMVTAATPFDDSPAYLDPTINEIYPMNYDKRFRGLVPLRTCLAKSLNIPATKLWEQVKSVSVKDYLNKVGFKDMTKDNVVTSTVMGGGVETNPLQMAGAYTPFANKGIYIEPILYTKVTDSSDKIIIEKSKSENKEIKQEKNVVYSEQGSYVMTDMMETVCESGTAAGLVNITNKNQQKITVAGKTGTTQDYADKWFVGYTPYYVGAVWYGDEAQDKSLPSDMPNAPALIWQKVMQSAHANLEAKEFNMPENIVKSNVCKYSGEYPSSICSKDQRNDAIIEEIFIKGTEPKPSNSCQTHIEVEICEKSTQLNNVATLATDKCPNNVKKKVALIKRPDPYEKKSPSDPYPEDWIYEYNKNNKCEIHSGFFDLDNWDDFFGLRKKPKDNNNDDDDDEDEDDDDDDD
ncbi:MAG: transglycosylase domain-containing protein [Clostridiales bacterium]